MRVYKVVWNDEPPKLFLAASVADAIAQDTEARRREWDDGENVDWSGDEGYQRCLTSVECLGELEEPYEFAPTLYSLIMERIAALAPLDPAADSRNGGALAALAAVAERYEKQKFPV